VSPSHLQKVHSTSHVHPASGSTSVGSTVGDFEGVDVGICDGTIVGVPVGDSVGQIYSYNIQGRTVSTCSSSGHDSDNTHVPSRMLMNA